jgi:5-methylcytosine-specific restriction endonuclease McrA
VSPIYRLARDGTPIPLDLPRHKRPERAWRHSPAWARLRRAVIAEEPACRACGSTAKPVVDHIVPVAEGGPILDRANVRRLCEACHHRRARGKL